MSAFDEFATTELTIVASTLHPVKAIFVEMCKNFLGFANIIVNSNQNVPGHFK